MPLKPQSGRVALVDILIRRYKSGKIMKYVRSYFLIKAVSIFQAKFKKISTEDYIFNTLAVLNYSTNIEEADNYFLF